MKLFLARDSVEEFGLRGSILGTGRRQPVRGLDCRGERRPSTSPQPVRVSGLAAGWKRGGLRGRRSVATERQRSSGGCRSRTGCIVRRHCHRCSDPPDGWGNLGRRRRRRAGAIRGGGAHRIGGSGPRRAGRHRCPGLARSSDHLPIQMAPAGGFAGWIDGRATVGRSGSWGLGRAAVARWRCADLSWFGWTAIGGMVSSGRRACRVAAADADWRDSAGTAGCIAGLKRWPGRIDPKDDVQDQPLTVRHCAVRHENASTDACGERDQLLRVSVMCLGQRHDVRVTPDTPAPSIFRHHSLSIRASAGQQGFVALVSGASKYCGKIVSRPSRQRYRTGEVGRIQYRCDSFSRW